MSRAWPIRDKLLLVGLLVAVVVGTLSASSFVGIYSYRRLVRSLSSRAAELPLASEVSRSVERLRFNYARHQSFSLWSQGFEGVLLRSPENEFAKLLTATEWALSRYGLELAAGESDGMPFGDRTQERHSVAEISESLKTLETLNGPAMFGHEQEENKKLIVQWELERLESLSAELPSFLQQRLHALASEVRIRYRTLIVVTWVSVIAAVGLLVTLGILTYHWVFRPLRMLGRGSRRVALGDFDYRIEMDTFDEMAELANALNDMTSRFKAIRDDLDRQVQLRTKEVIRSEQLASVGFLAAGVAHEINNPLASIAMCAESLDSRIVDDGRDDEESKLTRRYLELIQTEAFRCKGITEKLLDFSRLGEVRRQPTALRRLALDVADMLRHVGRFRGASIEIVESLDLLVMANPQELKQVILNLLVNALDSVEESGHVRIRLFRSDADAVLEIIDNGCGMDQDVLEHLFEPFFTRRKHGQGTGLGLSIVHRIVADHGGRIEVTSEGVDRGSCFQITFPLADIAARSGSQIFKEVDHRSQAA